MKKHFSLNLLHSKKSALSALPLFVLLTLITPSSLQADSGKQLFTMLCLACHKTGVELEQPGSGEALPEGDFATDDQQWIQEQKEARLAAPLITSVQSRYLNVYPQQAQFVAGIKAWVLNPERNRSLLPEMLHHYRLMPKLGLAEDQAEKVARFIYQTDFSRPDWRSQEPSPSENH